MLWLAGGGVALVLAVVGIVVGMSGRATTVVATSGSEAGVAALAGVAATPVQPAAPRFETHGLPFFRKHCLECHGAESPEAGISFANFTDDRSMLKQRKLFERALDLIQQGLMPPADAPQPTPAEKESLLAYLDKALFHVDCTVAVDPGRVTIRRLNRNEYDRTIRHLVGVSFQPAADFPTDDVGYGFDNIGDVLSLPPLLMEKYLEAAEAISREAVAAIDPANPRVRAIPPEDFVRGDSAGDHANGVMLASHGFVGYDLPVSITGEYLVRVQAGGQRAGKDLPQLELRIDNHPVHTFEVKALVDGPQWHEHKVRLDKGTHRIAAWFANDFWDPKKKEDRNLLVSRLEIAGPVHVDPKDYPAFHRSFVTRRPSAEMTVNVAVRENLRPFLRRAFRRAVQETELDPFVQLVQAAMEQGDSFDMAMQTALTATLVSPQFLFRVEQDRNPNDPNDKHPLNDFELASRLSYFLWSSMPDEPLLALAERNELHRDEVLAAEVKRMLADPRSEALVDNFAEQWLQLRILNDLRPDPELFPEFSPELRADMQRETKQLFTHIMRQDRNLLEFLDAKYTFVNERLAKHYGLAGVTGPEFREVSLEGTPRAGLLTHASVMTMTSNPNRTSPVKRGKWIMEVILNTPPPPAPPNVPELDTSKETAGMTFRQKLEVHRENATCNSCHRVMDELGFGLENFDAVGRYRETDGGTPLDVNGELPDGAKFTGSTALAGVLKQKRTEFARSISDRLLTYALGRGLEYYDRCTVRRIADQLEAGDFRFSALVAGIVRSEAFRMRRGEEAP